MEWKFPLSMCVDREYCKNRKKFSINTDFRPESHNTF